MSEPTAPADRRRSLLILLGVAIVILLAQIAREERTIHRLKTEASTAQEVVDLRATAIANERLQSHREDVVRAAQWLQDFYRSEEGLKRPDGLWLASQRQVDAEAIGVWLFDVYLKARVAGKTDDEARKSVADAIRGTDEWRRVHAR